MTDEMLSPAIANAAKSGATNVEFLKGNIESIPLPGNTIDVVISNCVINLSVDKPAVFAETFRVLRPGGRLGISDVVADDHFTPAERAERGSYVSCVAGALTFAEYRDGLEAAGVFRHRDHADLRGGRRHARGDRSRGEAALRRGLCRPESHRCCER
ncbi:methyltransferase domain-containing protein [Lentzea albida]|uniref:Arsenite methyltransferase n=1 Tax=Lentzea albida TaxID=65499 RepID=A0A1H9WT35_9PSEU|nr:Methyltransferase domain-containing protein [Lentzea albida]